MEHLDLDIGMPSTTPNDLSTLQPVDITSPMGASKIPHQPVTPNMNIGQGGNGQKGADTVNNFLMVNQRQSPIAKQHQNNFIVNTSAQGYQKAGPQNSNGYGNNFNGGQGNFNP